MAILYFAQFVYVTVILLLALVAFIVGNSGIAGAMQVVIATFVLSAFAYMMFHVVMGPTQQQDRNPWFQGLLLIVHGTFAIVMVFVCVRLEYDGVDVFPDYHEIVRYWKPQLPLYLTIAILLGGIVVGTHYAIRKHIRELEDE